MGPACSYCSPCRPQVLGWVRWFIAGRREISWYILSLSLQLVGLGSLPVTVGEVRPEQYGCQVVLGLESESTLSCLVICGGHGVEPEDVGVACGAWKRKPVEFTRTRKLRIRSSLLFVAVVVGVGEVVGREPLPLRISLLELSSVCVVL